jgi:hypothetical protein
MNKSLLLMIPVIALGLAITGCGDDAYLDSSGPTGFTFDLTGNWEGGWTSHNRGGSGPLSIEFLQANPTQGGGPPTALEGTAALVDFLCPALLTVDASFNPGGFVDVPHFDGVLTDGSITIQVFAIVGFDSTGFNGTFSGTYEVLEGALCIGDTGTIEGILL